MLHAYFLFNVTLLTKSNTGGAAVSSASGNLIGVVRKRIFNVAIATKEVKQMRNPSKDNNNLAVVRS